MTNPVSCEIRDGIATITMDDGKANALSLAMSEGINAALDQAATDAKVVIIRGRPGVLCGGFDLKLIRGDDVAARDAMRAAGMALMKRLFLLPQPLVMACTGHSVAAGGLLLLTGDHRIGTAGDYKIGLNEVAIGLAMPVAGIELARARLTSDGITEALLLAKLYTPSGAANVGYLDKVASPAQFDAEVSSAAKALLALDNPAFGQTKQRLRQAIIDRMNG